MGPMSLRQYLRNSAQTNPFSHQFISHKVLERGLGKTSFKKFSPRNPPKTHMEVPMEQIKITKDGKTMRYITGGKYFMVSERGYA